MMHIKRRDDLMQQIAAGVNKLHRHRICDLTVTLITDNNSFDFNLASALDTIANDLNWDERGDWSEANLAEVTVD